MRIAILTLPLHTNYGGILQAYALQTVLERMGHTVEVLQKKPGFAHPLPLMPIVYGKRIIKKILKDWSTPILAEQKNKYENEIIQQNTRKFIDKYIHIRELDKLTDVTESDYDAIVVGSDQVWRPSYFKKMWNSQMENAFLGFTFNWDIKRVAYAVSFGVDYWEFGKTETKICKTSANKFNAISVREDSGIILCNKYLNLEAVKLLDPTMLLEREDYNKLLSHKRMAEEGCMMCYILDKDNQKDQIINKAIEIYGLKPVYTNKVSSNRKLSLEDRTQPPVEDWLRAFRDTELIVTDSFHACVFSILFGKPFIAIGNEGRGLSRFKSLLGTIGLQERLYSEKFQYTSLQELNKQMDIVKEKICPFRKESLDFLNFNL